MHDVGFLTFCDSLGVTRMVCGHVRGAVNDIGLWYSCSYRHNIQNTFGNHQVLFDGIYRYVDTDKNLFVTRFEHAETVEEAIYNVFHSEARVIIENTYARQKEYFPIIAMRFPFKLSWIDIVYRCVVILTNVLIMHQSPMRAQ